MSNCLNLSHPSVKPFVEAYGIQETYKIYVTEDYELPSFAAYQRSLKTPKQGISRLKELVDTGIVDLRDIQELIDQGEVPPAAEAAYWKDAFYFGKNISNEAIDEEAFHRIYGRLISSEKREELQRIGLAILKDKLKVRGYNSILEFHRAMVEAYPQTYSRLTTEQGINRLAEEELAREFVRYRKYGKREEEWSKNLEAKLSPYLGKKTASLIRSLVDWLFTKLGAIVSSYKRNSRELDNFFDTINRGTYQAAKVIHPSEEIPVATTRLIQLAEDDFLPATESNQIIWNIGALVIELGRKDLPLSRLDRIHVAMREFKKFYESRGGREAQYAAVLAPEKIETIFDEETLEEEEVRVPVPEYHKIVEDLQRYVENLKDYEIKEDESQEDDEGSMGINEFGKEADEKGGFTNLSSWLKHYIATTGKEIKDSKGNTYYHEIQLEGREPLRIPVIEVADPNRIYYGLARGLSNTKDFGARALKLIQFGSLEGNTETRAFAERVMKDTGLTREMFQTGTPKDVMEQLNKTLSLDAQSVLTKVVKGFDTWVRIQQKILMDPANGYSLMVDANSNSAVKSQMERWDSQHNTVYINKEKREAVYERFAKIDNNSLYLGGGESQLEADPDFLFQNAKILTALFKDLGINLSPAYVEYSILSYQLANSPELEKAWKNSTNTHIKVLISNFDVEPENLLTYNTVAEIKSKLREHTWINLLDKDSGFYGRLEKIAEGNAIFDETVFESSYLNAEKKTIYAYQSPTFHLRFFNEFYNKESWEDLKDLQATGDRVVMRIDENGNKIYVEEDRAFYQRNGFLKWFNSLPDNSPLKRRVRAYTADGVSIAELTKGDNAAQVLTQGDGATFAKMTPRELALYKLQNFFQNENLYPRQGVPTHLFKGVYLGNLETSRTADFIRVPFLTDLIDTGGKITDKTVALIQEELAKEFERIQRVYAQIDPETGIYSPTSGKLFEKYNTGELVKLIIDEKSYWVPKKDFRALSFSDSVLRFIPNEYLATPTEATWKQSLVAHAMQGGELKDFNPGKPLQELIREGLTGILDAHYNQLWDLGIFYKDKDGKTKTLLDPRYGETGDYNQKQPYRKLAGFTKNQKDNLNRVWLSDLINTLWFNQLMHGDPALVYKNDGSDMFKRFKGRNGAIKSFSSPFSLPQYGINKALTHFRYVVFEEPDAVADVPPTPEEIAKGKKPKLDVADAQNWESIEARIWALHAQGKLNARLARILLEEAAGKAPSAADSNYLWENDLLQGSLKTVAYSGQQYLKKSDFRLSRLVTAWSEEITEDEYAALGGSFLTDTAGNRTFFKLREGASDVSAYKDANGNWKYFRWYANPGKQAEQLDIKRKMMEGFRYDPKKGDWVYKGEAYHIQLFMPPSASKMLTPNVVKKNPDTKQFDWNSFDEVHISAIDLNDYGLQVENAGGKTKVVDPTQKLQIILNEWDTSIDLYVHGKKIKGVDLEKTWQKYLAQRDKIVYNATKKSLIGEDGELDLSILEERIFENFLTTGVDMQTLGFADPNQPGGAMNFNLPLVRQKFIQGYFAYFTKEVLSHKRSGDAYTHVSSYGHTGLKRVYYVKNAKGKYILDGNGNKQVTWEYIRKSDPRYKAYAKQHRSTPLPDLSDTRYYHDIVGNKPQPGAASSWHQEVAKRMQNKEEIFILDSLRHAKPRWENGEITGYFDESLIPRHDTLIEEINEDIRYSFGVRIPSQDKHSFINIEWVDTLPDSYGSSIVVPKEVVYLSGGDFDVDKGYVTRPEVYWDAKQGKFVQYRKHEDPAKNWEEYLIYQRTNKVVGATQKVIQNKWLTTDENLDWKTRYEALQNEYVAEFTDADKAELDAYFAQNINQTAYQEELQKLISDPQTLQDPVTYGQISNWIIEFKTKQSRKSSLLDKLEEVKAYHAKKKALQDELLLAALKRLELPTSQAALHVQEDAAGTSLNPGVINNQMLQIEQGALNNPYTMGKGGQAHTPASLKALQDLKEATYGGVPMDKGGIPLFGSDDTKMSLHASYVQNVVHEKNAVGKQNIGVGVNTMIFMILATRLGLRVNPSYVPMLNGGSNTSVPYKALDTYGNRNFDISSTITTANTDEAKEGLNAFFNMDARGQAAVLHMVFMGYPLKSALLLINQPIIKKISKRIKQLEGEILTEDEQYASKNLEVVAKQALGILNWTEGRKVAYTTDHLERAIVRAKTPNALTPDVVKSLPKNLEEQIAWDYIQLVNLNDYTANLVTLAKMNKGFGSDLESFDRLVEALTTLGFNDPDYKPENKAVDIRNAIKHPKKEVENALAAQLYNFIKYSEDLQDQGVLQHQLDLQRKLFIERTSVYQNLYANLINEFAPRADKFLRKDVKRAFVKAIEGYLFTRLSGEEIKRSDVVKEEGVPTIVEEFETLRNFVRDNPNHPLSLRLANNSLWKRLEPVKSEEGIHTFRLNTGAKLLPQEQEELIDSFNSLYRSVVIVNRVPDTRGKQLAERLFTYLAGKDAFGFTLRGISKIFPPSMFRKLSDTLGDFVKQPGHFYKMGNGVDLVNLMANHPSYQWMLPKIKLAGKSDRAQQLASVQKQYKIYHRKPPGFVIDLGEVMKLVNKEERTSTLDTVAAAFGFTATGEGMNVPRYLQIPGSSEKDQYWFTPYQLVKAVDVDGNEYDWQYLLTHQAPAGVQFYFAPIEKAGVREIIPVAQNQLILTPEQKKAYKQHVDKITDPKDPLKLKAFYQHKLEGKTPFEPATVNEDGLVIDLEEGVGYTFIPNDPIQEQEVTPEPLGLPAAQSGTDLQPDSEQIYNQLGNKTETGNVVIKSVYQQEGVSYAKSIGGVFSLRINNSFKHFGNPFSSVPSEIAKGLISTKSTRESVERYINWLTTGGKQGFKLSIDKKGKDQGKADLANVMIAYGIPNSSTAQYASDAQSQSIPLNEEIIPTAGTVAFVSVNGNDKLTIENRDKTLAKAREVINVGGTVIMDSTTDATRSWNVKGENVIQQALGEPNGQTSKGYNYWGPNPEQRKWVVNQLQTNQELKGKPIVYYKELGEPSHATALDYLINKYNWNQEPFGLPATQSGTGNTTSKPELETVIYNYFGQQIPIILENGIPIDVKIRKHRGETNSFFEKRKQGFIESFNKNQGKSPESVTSKIPLPPLPQRITDQPITSSKPAFNSSDNLYDLGGGLQANKEQRKAIDTGIEFLDNGDPDKWFLIEGKAGTGKSTVIRKVLSKYNGKKSIVVSALSHKAKGVITNSINKEGINAQSVTIAGLLGMKMDLETGKFELSPYDEEYGKEPPINAAEIIVIDEASMVNEEMLGLIMSMKYYKAKVIFLGDIGQLPPIRTIENPYYQDKQHLFGSSSPVFNTLNKVKLSERVRQGEENPILPFADYYWENSQKVNPVTEPAPLDKRVSVNTRQGNLIFVPNQQLILPKAIEWFTEAVKTMNPDKVKIVTYRNTTREAINLQVHNAVFPSGQEYNEGELIIFNDKYGEYFENSDEVQVKAVSSSKRSIGEKKYTIFQLDVPAVNEYGAVVTKVIEVLPKDQRTSYQQYVTSLFNEARKYPQRSSERKEAMSNAWKAKNRFANVDYAYAITSHKSQGSTYDHVIVHESDILSVGPITAKEKSQSIYTALTRARYTAVLIGKTAPENNVNFSISAAQPDSDQDTPSFGTNPYLNSCS